MRRLTVLLIVLAACTTASSAFAGLQGYEVVERTWVLPNSAQRFEMTVECPPGKVLLGGGWYEDDAQFAGSVTITGDSPDPDARTSTWRIEASNGLDVNREVHVFATCAVEGAISGSGSASDDEDGKRSDDPVASPAAPITAEPHFAG